MFCIAPQPELPTVYGKWFAYPSDVLASQAFS